MIITNIWQGLGGFDLQYAKAMELGDKLSKVPALAPTLMTTGHSLGGGLASAAAVVGGFPADTFNAAGLLESTLLQRDAQGAPIPGMEIYAGSLNRYSAASLFISAYYLDWDILSFVQDKTRCKMQSVGVWKWTVRRTST